MSELKQKGNGYVNKVTPLQYTVVLADDTTTSFVIHSNQNWNIELSEKLWVLGSSASENDDERQGNEQITLYVEKNCTTEERSDTVFIEFLATHVTHCFIFTQNGNADDCMVSVKDVNWNPELKVYPNPNTGVFELKYNFNENMTFTTSVINVLGETVYQKRNIRGIEGIEKINVNTLPPGMYFLHVNGEGKKTTKKFIIQN